MGGFTELFKRRQVKDEAGMTACVEKETSSDEDWMLKTRR